jgi:hypothetical protein
MVGGEGTRGPVGLAVERLWACVPFVVDAVPFADGWLWLWLCGDAADDAPPDAVELALCTMGTGLCASPFELAGRDGPPIELGADRVLGPS